MFSISAQSSPSSHFSKARVEGNSEYRSAKVNTFSRLTMLVGALAFLSRAYSAEVQQPFAGVQSSRLPFSNFPDINGQCGQVCLDEGIKLSNDFSPRTLDNGVVLQGQLKGERLHGYGVKTYPTGGTDQGCFLNGEFLTGIRTYPPTDDVIKVFTGTFVDDELDGENGVIQFFSAGGKELLLEEKGVFDQGVMVKGTLVFACERPEGIDIQVCNTTKEGEFTSNRRLTEGTLIHFDGVKVTGKFDENERATTAEVVLADGTRLNGTFHEGKIVEGEVFLPDGTYYNGTYLNGQPHGENFTKIFPNGEKQQGRFVNGAYRGCVNEADIQCGPGSYYTLGDGVTICPEDVAKTDVVAMDTKIGSEATNKNDTFDWTFGWKKVFFG